MRAFDLGGEWPESGARTSTGLLTFPARLFAGLPVPVRIDVIDDTGRPLVIALGPLAEEAREAGEVVIDGDEWAALAEAAESERLYAADLATLLGTRGPGKITREAALSGANADPPRGWTVSTVLGRLGLHLAPAFKAPASWAPASWGAGPSANEVHTGRRAA